MARLVNIVIMGLIQFLSLLIRLYQLTFSVFLGRHCRFQPTCSEYARQALNRHGLRHGGSLAIRRILACHPLGRSGYDPVPKDFFDP